jgi:hypothetical protein
MGTVSIRPRPGRRRAGRIECAGSRAFEGVATRDRREAKGGSRSRRIYMHIEVGRAGIGKLIEQGVFPTGSTFSLLASPRVAWRPSATLSSQTRRACVQGRRVVRVNPVRPGSDAASHEEVRIANERAAERGGVSVRPSSAGVGSARHEAGRHAVAGPGRAPVRASEHAGTLRVFRRALRSLGA